MHWKHSMCVRQPLRYPPSACSRCSTWAVEGRCSGSAAVQRSMRASTAGEHSWGGQWEAPGSTFQHSLLRGQLDQQDAEAVDVGCKRAALPQNLLGGCREINRRANSIQMVVGMREGRQAGRRRVAGIQPAADAGVPACVKQKPAAVSTLPATNRAMPRSPMCPARLPSSSTLLHRPETGGCR